MSTLKVNTLTDTAATKSVPIEDVVNGTARAWVNFNGTGTVAINAQYNVSSITDNNTGDYTVNFTNAMPDANYSVVGTTSTLAALTATSVLEILDTTGTPNITTSSVRVTTSLVSGTLNRTPTDKVFVGVAIFR